MIGVKYEDKYAVQEVFQLLKVTWEWYRPDGHYDVVVAKKEDVPGYTGMLADLTSYDIFADVSRLLNEGEQHLHTPAVDFALDNLRAKLKQYTRLVEIPPVPWGHSYMVALTHDIDTISARQSSFRSAGFAAVRCCLQGKIGAGTNIVLAKFGLAKDPWLLFERWMKLERDMGVRSTFYFIPPHDTRFKIIGKDLDPRKTYQKHPYREASYDVSPAWLCALWAGGWEVGIHGMNNWISIYEGKNELNRLMTGGNRTHWLLHDRNSWHVLDEAGYDYDTTFGYDDDIGFRAGTMQVYQPRGVSRLLELPLHIQDVAMYNSSCWAPSGDEWKKIPCLGLDDACVRKESTRIFTMARVYGGVITLLWHYEHITPPRDWSETYVYLVNYAKRDGAWVSSAGNIVDWFRRRRETKITSTTEGNLIRVHVEHFSALNDIPGQSIRAHIDPMLVESVDAEFVNGEECIDIRCENRREDYTVVLV